MSILDFPSSPYPGQIWPPQKLPGQQQYIWSNRDRVWLLYKLSQFKIVPEFVGAVNEGETIRFFIQTSGVQDGTILAWTIENISTNSDDFDSALSGNVIIENNQATLDISIKDDQLAEDFEEFRVILSDLSGFELARSSNISVRSTTAQDDKVYSIQASDDSIIEGGSITFYIFTQNVLQSEQQTTLDWEISGSYITADKLSPSQLSGTVTLDSLGNASITFSTSNQILVNEESTSLVFDLFDEIDGIRTDVARATVTIEDLVSSSVINTLTASPSSINLTSGRQSAITVNWSGSNLGNSDIIKAFTKSSSGAESRFATIDVIGRNSGSAIAYVNGSTSATGALFKYYAVEAEQEKLIKTSNEVSLVRPTYSEPEPAPAPTPTPPPPSPLKMNLIWGGSSRSEGSTSLNIYGMESRRFWYGDFVARRVSGSTTERIYLSTFSRAENISFTERYSGSSLKSYTFSQDGINIDIPISVKAEADAPLPNGTYTVGFSLYTNTQRWNFTFNLILR